MSLETKRVQSNRVRVPRPSRGVATRVARYKEEHSVILHPDDYEELRTLDDLVAAACQLEPLEITELSERVHFEEDRPSDDPIEDPGALDRLFG